MTMTQWIIFGLVFWITLAVIIALGLGHMIKRADERERPHRHDTPDFPLDDDSLI